MGQYFKIVNLDKKEWLHPHQLGDGLKFGEFTEGPTMLALAFLLSRGVDGKGSGTWAGDRIVVCGDYGKGPLGRALYDASKDESETSEYKNISLRVRSEVEAALPWAEFGKRWDK